MPHPHLLSAIHLLNHFSHSNFNFVNTLKVVVVVHPARAPPCINSCHNPKCLTMLQWPGLRIRRNLSIISNNNNNNNNNSLAHIWFNI